MYHLLLVFWLTNTPDTAVPHTSIDTVWVYDSEDDCDAAAQIVEDQAKDSDVAVSHF